jgi:hypothetical protein
LEIKTLVDSNIEIRPFMKINNKDYPPIWSPQKRSPSVRLTSK